MMMTIDHLGVGVLHHELAPQAVLLEVHSVHGAARREERDGDDYIHYVSQRAEWG
jgi:hypothetical protein